MKLDDVKKNLVLTDGTTHIRARLAYAGEQGEALALEFLYTEGGLRFPARHYGGWAPVFHGYDADLYSDAQTYLSQVCRQLDRCPDWAQHIQEIMQKAFLKARLQKGQPVGVMVPDADGPSFYDGVVKKIDADGLQVTYDGGRVLKAKPKKVGKTDLVAYQGRGGSMVTLGGSLKTNQNNVVVA